VNDAHAAAALGRLLAELELDERAFGGTLTFVGEEPLAPSRHRIAAANAAAVAAQAIGVATLWQLRGGGAQEIRVDLERAVVPGLMPLNYLAQNGHSLRWASKRRGSNFFQAKDGRHVYVLHTVDYPNLLLRVLDFLDCSDAHEAIAKAVARWDSFELEEAMAEQKLVGGVARTRAEWAAHPQGQWLAAQPAISVEKIADGDPVPLGAGARPLSGIRVLDLGHILAGPTAARTLAEQGADVLRVGPPQNPDTNLMVIDTGMGKRSAFIDLDRAGDAEVLRGLFSQADVVVQSWRPGALDRRGFGPPDAARLRPGIVYLSISCYGSGGPWRERGGYDPLLT
jgi:crotonobetainyl-CoA:carnitine CoA-transferase CaiB-like acyl-CoA transferase